MKDSTCRHHTQTEPLFVLSLKRGSEADAEPIPRFRIHLAAQSESAKNYRIIARTSCETVSKVVTVFELASNARCATIRLENSVEILTFDCSSVLSSTVPRPPAPATPAVACPEDTDVVKLFPPVATSP